MPKSRLEGEVISLKSLKTATVKVVRTIMLQKYLKPIKMIRKFQVHNEGFELKCSDKVVIEQCRPISATKKFKIIKKI